MNAAAGRHPGESGGVARGVALPTEFVFRHGEVSFELALQVVVGPPALIRYNNLRAVTVQGAPAPGVSSGQALKAMEEVAARTLPQGFRGEWTDTALQEKRAEGKQGRLGE